MTSDRHTGEDHTACSNPHVITDEDTVSNLALFPDGNLHFVGAMVLREDRNIRSEQAVAPDPHSAASVDEIECANGSLAANFDPDPKVPDDSTRAEYRPLINCHAAVEPDPVCRNSVDVDTRSYHHAAADREIPLALQSRTAGYVGTRITSEHPAASTHHLDPDKGEHVPR